MTTRCGFAAVIGAPNAGKSTLVNALVGTKVSIVSRKVQTTRTRVTGIVTHGQSQIVFIDTPGIFNPKKRLERAMVAAAWEGAKDADLIILIVDASQKKLSDEAQHIVERLKDEKRPCVLVLNKIDLVDKAALLALSSQLNETASFEATFMLSALQENGTDDLLAWLADHVAEGPWLFPEGQVTDMPTRLLAAEVTREKIFDQLHQELPYAVAVETEEWEETAKGVHIGQVIYVGRDAHKPIVLGKGGSRIKAIGAASRKEMEDIFDERVHLKLFVKVRENWAEDPERYRLWGLDFKV